MRTRTLAALAATTLALTACGSSNTDASAPAPASPSASPSSSSASSSPTASSAAASLTPSPQSTYDNPDPDQPTGEALEAETPPPGDDADAQPAPFSSATDPAGQVMANSDAAAGKDITLRATSTNPGKASWAGFVSGDSGEEPVTGSWSKDLPGAGANLYVLDVQSDDLEGTVTCEVLVDGVVRDNATGQGWVTCTQPAEAN